MRGVTGWVGIVAALSSVGWRIWAPFGGSTDLPVVSTGFGLLPVALAVAASVVLIRNVRPWVSAAATYLAALGAMDATRLPAEVWWVARAGTEVSALWSMTNAVTGLALAVLGLLVVLDARKVAPAEPPTGWVRAMVLGCGVALAGSAVLPWWSTGRGGAELGLTFLLQPVVFQVTSILGVLVALAMALVTGATRLRGVWLGAVAGLLGTRPLVVGALVDPAHAAADVGAEPGAWLALAAQAGLAVGLVVVLARVYRQPDHVPG